MTITACHEEAFLSHVHSTTERLNWSLLLGYPTLVHIPAARSLQLLIACTECGTAQIHYLQCYCDKINVSTRQLLRLMHTRQVTTHCRVVVDLLHGLITEVNTSILQVLESLCMPSAPNTKEEFKASTLRARCNVRL